MLHLRAAVGDDFLATACVWGVLAGRQRRAVPAQRGVVIFTCKRAIRFRRGQALSGVHPRAGRDMSQPSAPSSRMRRRVELFENPLPQSLDCQPRAARDSAKKRFTWADAAHGGVPVPLLRTLAPHIKVGDADSAVGQAPWLTLNPAGLATRANTVIDSFETAKYSWTDSSQTVGTYVAKPETAGRSLARSTVRTHVCWVR